MRFVANILTLIGVVVVATSCFKDKAFDTQLMVVMAQQSESGGDFVSLDNSVVYAFAADTTNYRVANYDDALNGVLTNKLTGEQLEPLATGVYGDVTYEYIFREDDSDDKSDEPTENEGPQDGDLIVTTFGAYTMRVNQESVMLVAVDTESENYAYANYTVGLNLAKSYITVSFRPWKSGSFRQGSWFFVVPALEFQPVE